MAGSSQEMEQARGMGVILSSDFDPDILPGLSIGKQRRPLTSKYERARLKAETALAESSVAESAWDESACLDREDRGVSASTSGRTDDSWMTQEQREV